MITRVPVRISALVGPRAGGEPILTAAIPNSGFGSERPECAVPAALAKQLGLWPKLPPGSHVESYRTFGGKKAPIARIRDALRIETATEGASPHSVVCTAVVSKGEDEVVMSAALVSALEIILVDPGRGLWVFRGESLDAPRPSVPAQEW